MSTILLLAISNIFMTFAWYGHLKHHQNSPLWLAILMSWGIAFFEYCLMVPANRMGIGQYTLPQLKVIQEVITMVVFAGFSVWYMKIPFHRDFFFAGLCLIGAVFFMFRSHGSY